MNKDKILKLIPDYVGDQFSADVFVPGESRVKTNGRVFGAEEIENLVDAALDFWLTADKYAAEFSRKLSKYLGVKHAILCNSGSSANLLAITALTAKELENHLVPGDEVITVAAGFPTTVGVIVQNNLIPVFTDIELATYNIDVSLLEGAVSKRTRAVMLAHTLGHPFDLQAVVDFCKKYDLYLCEDNSDALGAAYKGIFTGTVGDLATQSFFPAHHITTGQGGAVVTNNSQLASLVRSFRDWGRACWCVPGQDNSCGKRYDWQIGSLPAGYDHKFIYTHMGYNLEMTDLQASIGCAQMERLAGFVTARKNNWKMLLAGLSDLDKFFSLPQKLEGCEPSWFGFALRVREDAPFTRLDIIRYLDSKKIETRLLFAGNLTRQPAFDDVNYRVAGELINTDDAMDNVFWLGVYPGLSSEAISYVIESIRNFVEAY